MRELTFKESYLISAGSHDINSFTDNLSALGETIQSYVKTDLLFGAIGLALLLSPAGWSMTIVGGVVGAAVGVGYGYVKEGI